jgi:hypothetical protein
MYFSVLFFIIFSYDYYFPWQHVFRLEDSSYSQQQQVTTGIFSFFELRGEAPDFIENETR